MKRIGKHGTYAILGLTAVSLIGIGFSSWIINVINGTVDNDVNVKVGDVVDKRLTCELVEGSQELNLNFDAKKDAPGGGVITADPNQQEDEDLTFGFSFRIYAATPQNYATAISGRRVYLTFNSTNDGFKGVVANKYILSPFAIDNAAYEET